MSSSLEKARRENGTASSPIPAWKRRVAAPERHALVEQEQETAATEEEAVAGGEAVAATTSAEKKEDSAKKIEEEQERQRQREESGDFGPIIIQCDSCHDHSWRIRQTYTRDGWVMADLDCVNGRHGAIGIKEKMNVGEPAKISSERPDVSGDVLITCGQCGHTNMFKTYGWFPVLHPGKGTKTVTVECSCGKVYVLKSFDSHQKK